MIRITNQENALENIPATDVDVDLDNDMNPQSQVTRVISTFSPTIHLHLPPNESGVYQIELNVTVNVNGGQNLGMSINTGVRTHLLKSHLIGV
ncbi:MAG: hypothetical protein ETSY1_29685 [Candidatus Entotheonella factor]|uniref:Uncharacterized protein n=1 Tax=Entotheonella factor TaxID=1429438 RepID=W4LC09_ENTF1|nr:MAG: hypothetical protein ETSY1_29685 [Candidatus Entotheonella factor]